MRIWVLFLLSLICVTVLVEAFDNARRKVQDKTAIAEEDEDQSVEEAVKPPSKRGASKNKKLHKDETDEEDEPVDEPKRQVKKGKKKAKQEEEVDDDENKPYPICQTPPKPKKEAEKKKNSEKDSQVKESDEKKETDTLDDDYDDDDGDACHCEMNDITCDNVLFEDNSKLDTLMLHSVNKDFIAYTFRARDNTFYYLEKDKIIPEMVENVREVDLSRNKVQEIKNEAFYNFKNMSVLRLEGNNLKKLDKNVFKGAPEEQLHQLFLNQNRFTSLLEKPFSLLKNLKRLVLDYNKIKVTSELFEGLENLEELSMDFCNLGDKNFDVNVFDKIPKLRVLSLRGNHFTEVPRAIQKLPNLELLDLSNTRISEFHEKSFMDDQSLKVLRAENMRYLWSLDDCSFCDIPTLEEIYLSNSTHLWNINKNAFGYVKGTKAKNMKKIDLTQCNVSILHEETLPWGENIELLMTENPVNCSCDTTWLLEEEYYAFNQENLMPKCKYPEKVEGKPLPAVQQSEVCKNIRRKHQGGRFLQAFVLLLLVSMICFTFYYLVTSGKLMNLLRPKSGLNLQYSNLSRVPNDEQPLERDFQPKPQDV
ncbi:unnamed protein product, partial [Mesorhabditis belari]|uniref:LRRCT domain-containing protein n=1 Tax=Mesorhabditis belari TaxID=2138241 RepID=A0AAF3EZ40_9BILA